MIFDTVVGPAWHLVGNDSPFVSNLIVESEKFLLVIVVPSGLHVERFNAQSISK